MAQETRAEGQLHSTNLVPVEDDEEDDGAMEDPADNTTVVRVLTSFNSYLSHVDSSEHDSNISDSSAGSALQSQYLCNLQVEEQADQSHYNSKLYHLMRENEHLALSAKRVRIETELELNNSASNYEREASKCRELALKLKHAQDREAELQTQLDAANVVATSHSRCKVELKRLTKEKEKLQQTQEKLDAAESKVMELQRMLMSSDLKMTVVTSERDEAQSRLDEQKRLHQEVTEKVRELEAVQTQCLELEFKNKTLEQQLNASEEDRVVVRTMRSQLEGLINAEKENKALKEEICIYRETQEKTMLLEEEVLSLQSKLARFQELQEQHAKLVIENEDLRKKLKNWESLDQVTGMNAKNPTDLNRKLSLLQHELLLLTQKNSNVTCSMRDAVRNRHRLEEEKVRLTAQLNEAVERKQQAEHNAQQLQRRCLMLTRERDGIRTILNSFDEVTSTGCTTQLNQRVREAEATTQRVNTHSVELEKQLGAAKEEAFNIRLKVQKLEADLALERSRLSAATRDFLRDEADQMCKKIEDLQEKLNTVTEQKAMLEMRLEMRSLQGDYDPTRTRVLQLKMNPHAAAQERRRTELLQLQDECDRLRERVRQLEQGGAVATAALSEQPSDSAESALPSRVIADLKKQVESAELKNKRLMEVFQKKVQEFRATCYALTGYQIDIPTEGQYKLTSMYAERQSDYLLFKSSGQMQLLETEFSQSVLDLINLHLHHQKSIPVFLSTVTLELFSRQTCPTMPVTQQPSQ